MKVKKGILLVGALCSFAITLAQTNPGETKDGNINLLDAQAQVLGDVFGESLGTEGITGYLDFLEKSDLPPAEKKKLADYYKMYSKTLDEKGKDSLNTVMFKDLMMSSKKDSIK